MVVFFITFIGNVKTRVIAKKRTKSNVLKSLASDILEDQKLQ